MKDLLAKIWVPTLLVMLAAVQSFGIDMQRSAGFYRLADSLNLISLDDSTVAEKPVIDSLQKDSLMLDTLSTDSLTIDTLAIDSLILTARDTIKIPDSLK